MSSDSDRNDISTEPSPAPGDGDNLGAEERKGTPPTVPPSKGDGGEAGDVEAEEPDAD
ncbi:hypothetical protein [Microbacterium sp. 179-I 3D3 NHS]|uniref:hypothetical protein n=1 Tax=unclassified Microbacterium TaxID=2609290 RepID=UPI0039A144CE